MNSQDLSGRMISHYRIIKPIGAGGMGEVYLAEDTQLDRKVALKILPPEVSSDRERMGRFVREAKAASAIDHPNIVHVYEINQSEDVNFIAMQYVDGETLRSKMNGKALSIEEFLQYATQLTDAMSEAHARGITHRDLKPANVMVSNKGRVKLLDFGLARIEKAAPDNQVSEVDTWSKTNRGVVMGTVAYMSPEQALGKQIDHRTDVFSMGIVFYEMATGRQPFSGNNPSEMIDKIVHQQPESISRLNYSIPQELERIIRKCMEKDPESRYQSTSEILIDLKNLKRDLDSGKQKSESLTVLQPKRKRIWIPIAVLLVLATIAGALIYRAVPIKGKEIRSLAVLPFKNVNLETEYLSDGITDSIINNISPISQIRVMARGTVFTYKNRDIDPRQVGKELGVDGVVTGKLLQEGNSLIVTVDFVDARDGSQIWGNQYDRKVSDILSLQSEISKEISNQLRIKLTDQEEKIVAKQHTANNEAYQLFLRGEYFLLQRSPQSVQKAMTFFQNAIDKDPAYALAYNGLADCYNYMGISGAILGGLPPKEVMPKAKELALKAIQLDETLPQAHRTLGHIYFNYDFDWEGADREIKRSLELNPNDSMAVTYETFFFVCMGKFDEAHKSMNRFKEIDPGYFPGKIISIGIQHYWMGEFDNAIQQLKGLNEMAPSYASPYYWLGAAYLAKKNYDQASLAFEKAIQYSNRSPIALSGLGMALAKAGKKKEAEAVLAEILERSEKEYVPEFWFACLYGAMGKKDEAFLLLDKAYSERANGLSAIKVLPLVDDLRSDPRFDDLLKRLKLN